MGASDVIVFFSVQGCNYAFVTSGDGRTRVKSSLKIINAYVFIWNIMSDTLVQAV